MRIMFFFILGNILTKDIVKKVGEPEGMFDINFTKAITKISSDTAV